MSLPLAMPMAAEVTACTLPPTNGTSGVICGRSVWMIDLDNRSGHRGIENIPNTSTGVVFLLLFRRPPLCRLMMLQKDHPLPRIPHFVIFARRCLSLRRGTTGGRQMRLRAGSTAARHGRNRHVREIE